jgi:hypothetical protein
MAFFQISSFFAYTSIGKSENGLQKAPKFLSVFSINYKPADFYNWWLIENRAVDEAN